VLTAKAQDLATAKRSDVGKRGSKIAGLICVALGSAIFLWWGLTLQSKARSRMVDFRVIYFNVKVLLNNKDPYNTINGEQLARDEGDKPSVSPIPATSEITCVYPPSALLVNAPLGLMSLVPAQRLWVVLNSGGLILSGLLLWEIAADFAPILAGALIGFLLANSAGLLFQGNVAGIVVSLCVIGTWCFFRERYIPLAIVCLAISLAIKPHDAGFIWLCLLMHRMHRMRAVYALLLTAFLGIISVAWVAHVAPGWRGELKANLVAVSVRGGGNDPGPSSGSSTIVNSDINLQTIIAVIKDDPAFYDPVTYLLCAVLLILWATSTWRVDMNGFRFWAALAFLSAFTMLPVYHRHHDAKLLMLSVPACALVWSWDRRWGAAGVVVTALAIAATADLPRVILTLAENSISFSTSTLSGKLVTILLARPAPLSISVMAIFYLIVYWRGTDTRTLRDSDGRTI
jgi:hypothetical protein